MLVHLLHAMMSHALGCHAYQCSCTTNFEPLLILAVNLTQFNVFAGAEQKLLKLVSLTHLCMYQRCSLIVSQTVDTLQLHARHRVAGCRWQRLAEAQNDQSE